MPPYKPYASKAQARKLHALAGEGKIAESEVAGKDKATDFDEIPERLGVAGRWKPGKVKMMHHSPPMLTINHKDQTSREVC
jgi:hypothetical protein